MGRRRSLNPADAYRKKQRQRELKKNKEERRKVREANSFVKDPSKLHSEVRARILTSRARTCAWRVRIPPTVRRPRDPLLRSWMS